MHYIHTARRHLARNSHIVCTGQGPEDVTEVLRTRIYYGHVQSRRLGLGLGLGLLDLLGVAHIASALWVRRRAAAGCEATDATR